MKIIDHRKTELGSIFRMPPPKKTRLNFIRLDKNERSNKHKNDFIKKLKKEISSDLISAYPEFHTIYKILAKKFKINTNNIVLTPGSDAALKNTFEIFYKKNKLEIAFLIYHHFPKNLRMVLRLYQFCLELNFYQPNILTIHQYQYCLF